MDILKHQVFGNTLDKWVKKSKMNKVFLHFFAATLVLHIAKLSKYKKNNFHLLLIILDHNFFTKVFL